MSRFHTSRFITPILLLGAVCAVACGASQHPSRSAARAFERCYSVDADPLVVDRDRLACWTAWRDEFDPADDHERVAYARGRVRALTEATSSGSETSVRTTAPAASGEPATRSLRGP
ncbi:MAG: hypothetical protein ACHREM_01355 [Polyangiales bacterium]